MPSSTSNIQLPLTRPDPSKVNSASAFVPEGDRTQYPFFIFSQAYQSQILHPYLLRTKQLPSAKSIIATASHIWCQMSEKERDAWKTQDRMVEEETRESQLERRATSPYYVSELTHALDPERSVAAARKEQYRGTTATVMEERYKSAPPISVQGRATAPYVSELTYALGRNNEGTSKSREPKRQN